MEEEPEGAVIEAKVAEMEAVEVALQAEVEEMINAVVQQDEKTFGHNSALELLVFVQVESLKEV